MQILLANAKIMFDKAERKPLSTPLFQSTANSLAAEMAMMDVEELARQLDCSPKIAAENWKRYQDFAVAEKLPAILAYNGQAYKHLRAKTLSDEALAFAQEHLWITCFLYGLLRPMDGIVPYRMEHCVTLEATGDKPVNQFWRDKLTDVLIGSVKADDGIIYAPIDGIVSSVSVSEGDNIMQNATIATLMDTSSVYLSTSVSEEDITALTVGQECTISLTAYDNKNFSGEIDTISAEPARSSGSVSYTVTVKLNTRNSLNVLEGMSGDVAFLQHQVTDVLTVNVNAITFRDGHSYVKVYDDSGNIVEKEVQTGFTDGRSVEITGVSAGDKLLAEITLSGGKE